MSESLKLLPKLAISCEAGVGSQLAPALVEPKKKKKKQGSTARHYGQKQDMNKSEGERYCLFIVLRRPQDIARELCLNAA
jgi:hypothetical protein